MNVLLSRSQFLHVLQECFCLIRGDALLAVRRHVGRLLRFLALEYRIQKLLVGQGCVEFLLGLLSVASNTLALVKRFRVRSLYFTLRRGDAEKDHTN